MLFELGSFIVNYSQSKIIDEEWPAMQNYGRGGGGGYELF